MKFNRTNKVLIFAVLFTAIIALLDIFAISRIWSQVGGLQGETYKLIEPQYLHFFWMFALTVIILASLAYYFARKDKSEAIALAFASGMLVLSGLEDFFFYIFAGIPFEPMPWLYNGTAGFASHLMGMSNVNVYSLLVNIALFGIVTYFVTKYLVEKV
jgi:hypothetical protein